MKTTEKLAMIALGIGAAAAGALYWYKSDLSVWAYIVVGVIIAAVFHKQLIANKAAENLANKDVTKN